MLCVNIVCVHLDDARPAALHQALDAFGLVDPEKPLMQAIQGKACLNSGSIAETENIDNTELIKQSGL